MKDRFYFACMRDNVGSNVSFHCKDGKGYSTDISRAHVYTREEAQQAWEFGREFEVPLSADHVDAVAVLHVDHQYVAGESEISAECDKYVAYEKGVWNGNDLRFFTSLRPSFDYSQARVFTLEEVTGLDHDEDVIFIPKAEADKVARATLFTGDVNRRTMTQGAGLKQPRRITNIKRRVDSGKTRVNCPVCGKISWQYNPYDFDGCNDRWCSAYEFKY